MSALGFVAIVIAVFFVLGIGVGVVGVVALAARRREGNDAGSGAARRGRTEERERTEERGRAEESGWRAPEPAEEFDDEIGDDNDHNDGRGPYWPGHGYRN
jgi:hypothetical protein